jgi:hypothetical protein
MKNKDFMNYKIILGSKKIIPTELINIIVDGYLDNRLSCFICKNKFIDLETDISYARVCFICNNLVCECCYSTSLIYGTIEALCDFCEFNESDSESED